MSVREYGPFTIPAGTYGCGVCGAYFPWYWALRLHRWARQRDPAHNPRARKP